jgi:protein SCO1
MKNWRIWLILAFVIVAGATVYFFQALLDNTQSYEGTELSDEAQDFELTDQNGSLVNLSDFRGKVVVLTFMDSKCLDTCPLTAAHFREVYRQLNPKQANQVVFLGVNVNLEENTVDDVLESTRTWHLDEIPSWHFLTGNREELEPVWNDYDVSSTPSLDGYSIMHTPGTFLIDPLGQKRWYISTPFSGDTDAEQTLPLSQLLLNHVSQILRDH